MTSAAKIAISLPAKTLSRLEKIRKRSGSSRSALIVEAIEEWLQRETASEDDRRYVEAYQRHPEAGFQQATTAQAVVGDWEPWE